MASRKILYVIDHFKNPNAGTENQLFKLISGLDRDKFDPHLLVFSDSEYLQTGSFPCDYTVLNATSIKSPKTWFKLYKLARVFKKQGFELAHIFFNDPSIICPPVFASVGIKSIISRRDMGYWYTKFYLTLLRVTKHFVAAVTTNSQAVKNITAEKENIPADKIHVIYNGYNFEEHEADAAPNQTLIELKAEGATLVFLVANVRPIKRIQDAVKAIANVVKQQNKVHFIQIGDGDASELKALAKQLNAADNCHFLGPQSNVAALLPYADIGLLCSESEGFSNAIVEYQLAECPVVCSNVGGNPEAVAHEQDGFLYEAGDVETLTKYLHKVTTSDSMRVQMGTDARNKALTRYNISNIVAQNQSLYVQLMG